MFPLALKLCENYHDSHTFRSRLVRNYARELLKQSKAYMKHEVDRDPRCIITYPSFVGDHFYFSTIFWNDISPITLLYVLWHSLTRCNCKCTILILSGKVFLLSDEFLAPPLTVFCNCYRCIALLWMYLYVIVVVVCNCSVY